MTNTAHRWDENRLRAEKVAGGLVLIGGRQWPMPWNKSGPSLARLETGPVMDDFIPDAPSRPDDIGGHVRNNDVTVLVCIQRHDEE